MYATHPNRYGVEQIRKLAEEGMSVEDISRHLMVEESGVEAHLPKVEEPKVEEPKVEEPKVEEPKAEEPKANK